MPGNHTIPAGYDGYFNNRSIENVSPEQSEAALKVCKYNRDL